MELIIKKEILSKDINLRVNKKFNTLKLITLVNILII